MQFVATQLRSILFLSFTCFFIVAGVSAGSAQKTISPVDQKTAATDSFVPSGRFSALAFGDIYYKAHSDSLNRGGSNQYTGINQNRNGFQFRRIYLGYNYAFTKELAAEILLAAEDNTATNTGSTNGDLLLNNKLSFYIKFLNIRWKDIWKGTDLVIGQSPTPAYALLTEKIWNYRSVEKTITDIRKTSSYDLGLALQGVFDPATKNFGYNLMIANGTGDKPETDAFKKFYGEFYAKFFNQQLIVDLYADYERYNWTANWHHSRSMLKAAVMYATPSFTLGTEGYLNRGNHDFTGTRGIVQDTLNGTAHGLSVFTHGRIIENKLGFFARVDFYNPDAAYDAVIYSKYSGFSASYEPNTKERLIIAGLDFTPLKNLHLMPNIWYNHYAGQQNGLYGSAKNDHDLVYRLTFYTRFNR